MIKTLRITTILAGVLAVIFLVLPMFFGGRTNQAIEQFLDSSGVVEKYNVGAEYNAKASQDEVSPLVIQAETFAEYLNPPPEELETGVPEVPAPTVSPPKPRGPVTAKFTLVGTSVYVAQPELSLAFINEPGKGSRWVRQGSQVEHLTIKEVKDGLVVLQDGQRTSEIAVQQKPEISLVENPPSVSSEVMGGISIPAQPRIDQEALEKFIESVRAGAESGEVDPQNVDSLLSVLGSMRISDDEAEKLQRLPEEQLGPEPAAEGQDSSQQPSPAEGERITEPERDSQQSTIIKTPVDYKERLTAEPNQTKNPTVRRPVRLPRRTRRNR